MRSLFCLALALLPAAAQPRLEVTSPLGTKFYSLADSKGVVAEAEKALAAGRASPDLLLKLAQAQISVWQDREAVETLTRALAARPSDAALLTERGHRELALREFQPSVTDSNRATAIDPNRMEAYYDAGLALYFLGRFAEASQVFRKAVEHAPNQDEVINSTNWLYASLRRSGQAAEAAKALAVIAPDMKNQAPHTEHYLNLIRLFQGAKTEAAILPPEPTSGNTDDEIELRFDTVAYGIGNRHLYNGENAKAQEYFRRVLKGHVWITWGFIGSEVELAKTAGAR